MFSTCDLYDQYQSEVTVCNIPFIQYGGKSICSGQAYTVKCYQDNTQVKHAAEHENGQNKVLVVDGGSSCQFALLGDLIAASATKNLWEGIIILGALRDVTEIKRMDIAIKALGSSPAKTNRQGQGLSNVSLAWSEGIVINPGEWIYSDDNGILISSKPLSIK